MYRLSRNDKCWCGSGKKYKQCHERSDERILMPLKRQGYPIPPRRLILNAEQIQGIRESAKITVAILDKLEDLIEEGITTEEINTFVHKYTLDHGGVPAPLNYQGFPKSCCTSINDVIAHGIPCKTALKNGDIINVDITTILNGYYSDSSRMYMIGDVAPNAKKLVEVTKECMYAGIKAVKPYRPVSDIGNTINAITDKHGYGVVRDLCGHGVGIKFHDDPLIEHYRQKRPTMIMVPGMVFTIEPMINEGTWRGVTLSDNWTFKTQDKKLSAQWEHTIVVTEDGCEILTK
ncbi:MAG: methionyl aminopeptidase [Clostridiales bacterium]|nr:methionyl aminopeptidase [Clostridiales bacterium]MCD8216421.1 methionyl aminopeptidase [Clostridiales bacterium]